MEFELSLVKPPSIGSSDGRYDRQNLANSSGIIPLFGLFRGQEPFGPFEVLDIEGKYLLTELKPIRGEQPSQAIPQTRSASGGRRVELEWRRTHRKELLQYAGQYVVLEGEKIIAHGPDPRRVLAEAQAKDIPIPYIFFVDDAPEDASRTGL